ncbi:DUF6461 domain-containing protein [Nonomuraea sp. WAC 01424]|uniref:DUF6461 domain-containing protein n=1 Tax=Nonomuraea sp. WAC 01424 TaxID=2203200 RepID=UPI000F79A632|nr:DUF6461 domain-containing protein [Nonomuraea sp. WAC 01424]
MVDDEVAREAYLHYRRLLDGSWMGEAICWTVFVPHDGSALSLAEIGERVSGTGQYEIHETNTFEHEEVFMDLSDDAPWGMLVDRSDRHVALFECNGYQSVFPPVLPRLSTNGRAHSAYWNVNATNSIGFAVDGEMVFSFDAMYAEEATGRPGWDRWPEVQAILRYFDWEEGESWRAAALTAIELATGARLSEEWVSAAPSFLMGR